MILKHPFNEESYPWLSPLLEAFGLGCPQRLQPLQSGLIQETWLLQTDQQTVVAQKLHPIFDPKVTEDGQAISAFLRSQGLPTPPFLTTTHGSLHLYWQDQYWRVMSYLSGSTHRSPPDPGYLRQAGYLTGKLHQALARFDYQPQFQIPYFHDTAYIHHQLQRFPLDQVAEQADFLLDHVPKELLPTGLPQQLIHGDLKLTNFLFDQHGSVVGLLDLDTFMIHSIYVELGDAFRSWAAVGSEFDPVAFGAGMTGYAQAGGLVGLDPDLILQGIRLITLELAMRFLKDTFEDYYFAWDPQRYSSRVAHNLARCRQQIALYRDVQRQQATLLVMLNDLFHSGVT